MSMNIKKDFSRGMKRYISIIDVTDFQNFLEKLISTPSFLVGICNTIKTIV